MSGQGYWFGSQQYGKGHQAWAYVDEAFSHYPYQYIDAAKDDEGVYVITTATRKARQWRTNPQSPTVSPEPFKQAAEKFFRPT